ncbi:MAG: transposase [Nitrospiraceae bacterium]|nr:transposase [Nitrospiraceae bacterium]
MARPLRIEYAGAVYHVTSRGNERKPVFKSDEDRMKFLNTLQHVNKRYNWICHGYCLMDNHYHLLIETPDGNLSLGMRQLNGVYTQLFNRAHGRAGHLFQGRYKSILIQKDSHLLEVCRYVVLNPVRAKMVEAPEAWKWSSYRATAGRESRHPCLTTDWVLGQFGRQRAKAEKDYKKFVGWGIGKSIWHEVRGQAVLGEDAFAERMADHLRKHKDIPDIPRSQRYAHRPALERIFPAAVLKDRLKRDRKIAEAVEKYGYSQRAIAAHLSMHYSYVSIILRKLAQT